MPIAESKPVANFPESQWMISHHEWREIKAEFLKNSYVGSAEQPEPDKWLSQKLVTHRNEGTDCEYLRGYNRHDRF